MEVLYALAAIASGGAALLAWGAKLRWAQEYKAATEQVIKAKEAEIGSLKTEISVLQSVSSGKILEHAVSTKRGLEEIIQINEEELKGARAIIEGLKIEISDLRTSTPQIASTPSSTQGPVDPVPDTQLLGRAETLHEQLREAQHEERLLREKHLAFRAIALEDAPELARRYAGELHELRGEHARLEAVFEERKTSWLRDKQDAETKLQNHRDRGIELKEQIRLLREQGPHSVCPTCGRAMGTDYERSLDELEEHWESIVHDGKWWKSRYNQLTQKPEDVVALERQIRSISEQIEETTRKHIKAQAAAQELEEIQRELRSLQDQRPMGEDA